MRLTRLRLVLLGVVLVAVGLVLTAVTPFPQAVWLPLTIPGGFLVGWNIFGAVEERRRRRFLVRLRDSEWRPPHVRRDN